MKVVLGEKSGNLWVVIFNDREIGDNTATEITTERSPSSISNDWSKAWCKNYGWRAWYETWATFRVPPRRHHWEILFVSLLWMQFCYEIKKKNSDWMKGIPPNMVASIRGCHLQFKEQFWLAEPTAEPTAILEEPFPSCLKETIAESPGGIPWTRSRFPGIFHDSLMGLSD